MLSKWLPDLEDLLVLAGAGGICWGLALIHYPSAMIAGGVLLILFGLIGLRRRDGAN